MERRVMDILLSSKPSSPASQHHISIEGAQKSLKLEAACSMKEADLFSHARDELIPSGILLGCRPIVKATIICTFH